MNCQACGSENREGRKFCGQCGNALSLACASCGASNEAGERFCGECGGALEAGAAEPTAEQGPDGQAAASSPDGVTAPTAERKAATPAGAMPESFAGGRYEVKAFLGEGGRKRVYLARDTRLDRDVAVAVIKTEGLDDDGLARVRREAQAMAKLGDHPHIVTIHDIGEENGQPYIVSQYMAGGELGDLLSKAEGRKLGLAQALKIATEVREALEHAHAQEIIHRDIKPANIWLTEDGTAKLGDFGLAVALDRSRLTMEGTMVGTVAYMPPEQALGKQPDARSDIYSLGCVLYEMLTGRPPFLGDDNVAIISQHINTAPVAPTWHNPDIPKALESLIMRCLAKNPEERPESAAAIPDVLEAITASAGKVAERVSEETPVNPLDRLAGGVFVGRDEEMDELRAGLEDALSGRGRLLMLVGEPGIGKTRTSEELATYAGLRNAQVVWGRCYEGEGAPAYWPWVQAIRSYVHEQEPNVLMSQMGPGAADIAQVVSDVKDRLPGLPEPPTLEPEQARFRLFDSITNFLKNASKEKPMVLVLDDLHWADKPSLLLLQFLARELRGSRLMVLGTYRDVELRRAHPLSQTLGELGREGLSHRILLRGLTEQDVARFIEITSGKEPPKALVEAVYKETEGNPFFVNEVVRLLVADGRLEKADEVSSWSVTIPQGVREVVGRRLDHLSEECNRALTIGAVIGRQFDLKTVEQALATSEEGRMTGDRLLEVLEEAVGARVVTEVPNSVETYSFSHALIRETLYEELSTARRVRLHRQIGEVLEAQDAEGNLAPLAYHFAEAAQGGDIGKAIDYATRAGERALSMTAYEEAAGHYERALQVMELDSGATDEARCDLLLTLGDAQFKSGDLPDSQETFDKAIAVARRLKDAERLGRAVLGRTEYFEIGEYSEVKIGLLDEALAAVGKDDSATRALLLARRGMQEYFNSWELRTKFAMEGVAVARRVGDKATLARCLWSAVFGSIVLRDTETHLLIANEAVQLAEEIGNKELFARGLFMQLGLNMILGNFEAAYEGIERFIPLAQELRLPEMVWYTGTLPAMQAFVEGRVDDAEKLATEAFALGQRYDPANAMTMYSAQMIGIRREQGRVEEMINGVKAAIAQFPLIPTYRAVLAYNYTELGQMEDARREFDVLAEDNFSVIPQDGNWPIAMLVLAQACVALGDKDRAAILYDMIAPYAEKCVVVGSIVTCYGVLGSYSGALLTTMGRLEEAERELQAALEKNTRIGAVSGRIWTQCRYAEMLLARDGEGDRRKALDLLTEAINAAQPLGMKQAVDVCLELKLKAQGVDSSDLSASIDAVASLVYNEKPDLKSHASPDGTVTLLFSDIEGSTAKTEELGDTRWMEVLREHNAIVREQVSAHGGFEVKSEGDGFMLAFQSARKALQCAVAMQRAFEARNNGGADQPIRVRIGLHTGEVIKEGDDFFGKHVNLAARIASQASGGEILVSSLLRELTASGGDIAFDGGREVELKGLSEPQRVYAVAWGS